MLYSLLIQSLLVCQSILAAPYPATKNVVALDISVNRSSTVSVISENNKRALSEDVADRVSFYTVEIFIGSDKQAFNALVDTGSSDLWVNSISNGQCDSTCKNYGTFDSSKSNSISESSESLTLSYQDGTVVNGNWATDTVSFTNGQDVSDLKFGIVTSGDHAPILGIGLKSLERASSQYPNLPYKMVEQGIISKPCYSLYLNPERDTVGKLIFGGYDTEKFEGDLVKVPHSGPSDRLSLNIDALKVDSEVNVGTSAVFDSGYTFTYLPDSYVSQIASQLGFLGYDVLDNGAKRYFIPNSASEETLTIFLDGTSVDIPVSSVMDTSITYNNGNKAPFAALTIYGRVNQDESLNAIGDNILRNLYLFYDLTDASISLAKVKASDNTNIVSV